MLPLVANSLLMNRAFKTVSVLLDVISFILFNTVYSTMDDTSLCHVVFQRFTYRLLINEGFVRWNNHYKSVHENIEVFFFTRRLNTATLQAPTLKVYSNLFFFHCRYVESAEIEGKWEHEGFSRWHHLRTSFLVCKHGVVLQWVSLI